MSPHQTLQLKPQCGLPPTQDPAEPRLNAHFVRLSSSAEWHYDLRQEAGAGWALGDFICSEG